MNRRGFLRQLGLVIAAPAIVRATSLMKVAPWEEPMIVMPGPVFYRITIPWRMVNQDLPYPDVAIDRMVNPPLFDEVLYETL